MVKIKTIILFVCLALNVIRSININAHHDDITDNNRTRRFDKGLFIESFKLYVNDLADVNFMRVQAKFYYELLCELLKKIQNDAAYAKAFKRVLNTRNDIEALQGDFKMLELSNPVWLIKMMPFHTVLFISSFDYVLRKSWGRLVWPLIRSSVIERLNKSELVSGFNNKLALILNGIKKVYKLEDEINSLIYKIKYS